MATLVAAGDEGRMKAIAIGGFALALLVTACTSQASPRDLQTPSGAGQHRTPTLDPWDEDRTALALGTTVGIDHDLLESMTEEAMLQREEDRLDEAQERATFGAIMQLTNVAGLDEQYRQEVRQCVQDGYSETLCLRDPQAAYDPSVQRCLRDGHTEELCLFDPNAPYDP